MDELLMDVQEKFASLQRFEVRTRIISPLSLEHSRNRSGALPRIMSGAKMPYLACAAEMGASTPADYDLPMRVKCAAGARRG
jgi:hypothetical protein